MDKPENTHKISKAEKKHIEALIDEESEESFPASDPPSWPLGRKDKLIKENTMSTLFKMDAPDLAIFHKHWGWFLVWGLALMALGLVAIGISIPITFYTVLFLGVVLMIAGVVVIFDTFKFWWGKWGGFITHLVWGLLYIGVGALFIRNPFAASLSLTFVLAVFFIIIGVTRIMYALFNPLPRRGWRLFAGIVTLILGLLILAQWPATGLFIIGLFIGIDLLIAGATYTAAAIAARK